jgi:hypothetical protein
MTNGCLGALESAAKAEKAEGEAEERCAGEEDDEAGGDDRRRPEKWGPEAASIT